MKAREWYGKNTWEMLERAGLPKRALVAHPEVAIWYTFKSVTAGVVVTIYHLEDVTPTEKQELLESIRSEEEIVHIYWRRLPLRLEQLQGAMAFDDGVSDGLALRQIH
jgi:hypothetical protein